MSSAPVFPTSYRPEIDGLRAVAVLAVLFYHADIALPGGYIGVDVFLVISGFLITGLILKDLDAEKFSIVRFWERRIRRILPALALVVFATLVGGWFMLVPDDYKELGQSAFAQALLASNVFFYLNSDYFAPAAQMRPLLHTWSLAVEEQFYMLFPLLLLAINRFSRRSLVPAIVTIGTASLIACIYCSYQFPLLNFYLLPSRAWELSLGSFLAAVPGVRMAKWLHESISWAGLLSILMAVLLFGHHTRFPGTAALLPCLGTAALIWANGVTLTSVGRVLAWRPFVFVGLISYSLYLWHWPLLVFARHWSFGQIPLGERFIILVASFGLAILSWKFVETPFRKGDILSSRRRAFVFAGLCSASLAAIGLTIHTLRGVPSRIPPTALAYRGTNISDEYKTFAVDLPQAKAGQFYKFGAPDRRQPVTVFLWGDSHAMPIVPVLDALSREQGVSGLAALNRATVPLVGFESTDRISLGEDSIAFNAAVVNFIRRERIPNVVLVARWDRYLTDAGDARRLSQGFSSTARALEGSGSRLWIIRQVPLFDSDAGNAVVFAAWHGRNPDQLGLPLGEHLKEMRRQDPAFLGLEKYPWVSVLDPTGLFLGQDGMCRISHAGKALYFDNNHLTLAGANMLRPLLKPTLRPFKSKIRRAN